MIFIEQEKGSHYSTMQKGSPKRTSTQKSCRNIYIESIHEGIGMCLKFYKQNLQWRVCQSLGLFKCFNKYGYLDQSIHGISLKIDDLRIIDAICSLKYS